MAKVDDVIGNSTLPDHIKLAVTQQLESRSFDIQLFMGETSKLGQGHIERLREVNGKLPKDVVVLPRRGG